MPPRLITCIHFYFLKHWRFCSYFVKIPKVILDFNIILWRCWFFFDLQDWRRFTEVSEVAINITLWIIFSVFNLLLLLIRKIIILLRTRLWNIIKVSKTSVIITRLLQLICLYSLLIIVNISKSLIFMLWNFLIIVLVCPLSNIVLFFSHLLSIWFE